MCLPPPSPGETHCATGQVQVSLPIALRLFPPFSAFLQLPLHDPWQGTHPPSCSCPQGPPGTGKTTTIMGLLSLLLRQCTLSAKQCDLLLSPAWAGPAPNPIPASSERWFWTGGGGGIRPSDWCGGCPDTPRNQNHLFLSIC